MSNRLRFAAVGDIYLGGLVGDVMGRHGADFPFTHVGPLLRGFDLVFGNLEGPITAAPSTRQDGPTWKSGREAAPALAAAGLHVLNCANNHIGDCGNAGMAETTANLGAAGLTAVGVGPTAAAARTPAILERRGVRVAFLGYCDSYLARGGAWGGAPIRGEMIGADVAAVRDRADVVVVSLHHGIEYSDYPEPAVVRLTRDIVDAGADLVLGHHPHVLQGWERHGRGIVVHSLGNFVADFADPAAKAAAWERSILVREGLLTPDAGDTRTEEAIVFTCALTREGVQDPDVVPVVINTRFQPVPAEPEGARRIRERLARISAGLGDLDLPVFRDLDRVSLKVAMLRARPSRDLLLRLHRLRPRHAAVGLRYLWSRIAR